MVNITVKRPFLFYDSPYVLYNFYFNTLWSNLYVMLAPHRDDHIFEYKEGQWQASSRAGVGRTHPLSHHAKDRHEETCTLLGDIGSSHIRELEDLLVPRTIMPRIPKIAVTHRLANGW